LVRSETLLKSFSPIINQFYGNKGGYGRGKFNIENQKYGNKRPGQKLLLLKKYHNRGNKAIKTKIKSLPFSIYGSKVENRKMSFIGQNSPKKGSKNVVFMVILFDRFSRILK
jgi:hypothetical protein